MASEKESDNTLRDIAVQLLNINKSLAQIGASLAALKAVVALQMNPSSPEQALKRIQGLEEQLLKSNPKASELEQMTEIIEAVKLAEKHGGFSHS